MVLKISNLNKRYGKKQILDNVSFEMNEGEVLGFLGPNGAGKTTTLKIVTDLVRADSGTVLVNGFNIRGEREKALSQIGAVIENPEHYGYLTARVNLEMMARMRKIPFSRIDEVAEFVKLKDRLDDKVKTYSLGMKQRLGIAIALLSKPKLLILDEPTNGLDPEGIAEFRELVRTLKNEMGTSVLISSHQLSEIQQIADRVVFIDSGKITAAESLTNLKSEETHLIVGTKFSEKTEKILITIPYISDFKETKDGYLLKAKESDSGKIVKELVLNDVEVNFITPSQKNLEVKYFEIMKGR